MEHSDSERDQVPGERDGCNKLKVLGAASFRYRGR